VEEPQWQEVASEYSGASESSKACPESSRSKLARLSWGGDTFRAPMIGIAGTVLMPQSCERYLGHAATNLF
jgi:hypothetical protein